MNKVILPFRVGDTIKISQKIKEGEKERTVSFNGQVLDIKGSSENTMFTVRQIIEGIAVDKIFPYQSPTITSISAIAKPKKRVRRSNLVRIKTK